MKTNTKGELQIRELMRLLYEVIVQRSSDMASIKAACERAYVFIMTDANITIVEDEQRAQQEQAKTKMLLREAVIILDELVDIAEEMEAERGESGQPKTVGGRRYEAWYFAHDTAIEEYRNMAREIAAKTQAEDGQERVWTSVATALPQVDGRYDVSITFWSGGRGVQDAYFLVGLGFVSNVRGAITHWAQKRELPEID